MTPEQTPSRRQRLLKNGLFSLLSWLLPLLPTFIVTPIIVHSLGNEQYGVYVVIVGFISYFFAFGIGKSVTKYVSEYKASGETHKIAGIYSATLMTAFSLGLLGTVVVILLARPIVTDVLLIDVAFRETAVLAMYLAWANIFLLMVTQTFQYVLQGLHRFDRFLLLTNVNSLLVSIGSVLLVWRGFGILALLLCTLSVAVFVGLLSYVMARRLLPEMRLILHPEREAWVSVRRYAGSIIAYQIFGNILLLFERGWMMRTFGAEAVTFYAVPMTLAMYIHLFTGSLILAIFPMVNELLTEKEKLLKLYQKSTKLIIVLVTFAVVSAISLGKSFLAVWIGQEFAQASYILLVIHVLTFGLLAMNTVVWQVAESFKAATWNAIATFAWMGISIPAMVVLSSSYAGAGVAMGRLAGVFVFIPLILLVESRFLGGINWGFWGSTLLRVAGAAGAACIAEIFVARLVPGGWLSFLLAVGFGAIVYVGALLIAGTADDEDRQLFAQTFRRRTA